MDWSHNRKSNCCDHGNKHHDNKHQGKCGCNPCGNKFHNRSHSSSDCCGKRRSVIVQCHCGNCNEVQKHHCCDGSDW